MKIVTRVVDASDPAADFGNAAVATDRGYAIGWHVTDDPSYVAETLLKGISLTVKHKGEFQDLGPGFYVSAVPQLWMGRARSKWEFLKRLDARQRRRLALAIIRHPNFRVPGYLSRSERQVAIRELRSWVSHGYGESIIFIADQPYNIRFWQPDFLRAIGIEPSRQPVAVETWFRGRYAELRRYPSEQEYLLLYRSKLDGMFLRGGMTTEPQLVIWRNSAIIRFGDIYRTNAVFERRPAVNARRLRRKALI